MDHYHETKPPTRLKSVVLAEKDRTEKASCSSPLLGRADLIDGLEGIIRQLTHGCGNHGCRINPPTGMGTNAICSCTPKKMARNFRCLKERMEEYGNQNFQP